MPAAPAVAVSDDVLEAVAAGRPVVLAALSRRAWLLAVAVIFLSPTIGLNTLTLLAAIPRLAYALEPDAATSRHGRTDDAITETPGA